MPNSLGCLQVRLRMERDKLVDWDILADLSEDKQTLSPGLQLHKHVVNDTLQEIKPNRYMYMFKRSGVVQP